MVPTDTIDTSELQVSQEWVNLPSWAGDYFLGVQVEPDESWVRIWGYCTHEQLKHRARYFELWGALLEYGAWIQQLYERRLGLPEQGSIQKWLDGFKLRLLSDDLQVFENNEIVTKTAQEQPRTAFS